MSKVNSQLIMNRLKPIGSLGIMDKHLIIFDSISSHRTPLGFLWDVSRHNQNHEDVVRGFGKAPGGL